MCGINGIIGFNNSKFLINQMNETLKHRGPDSDGTWFCDQLALGHRRLSIIDLSIQANQPFIKDNLIIVYNGEVYNYPELKNELLDTGVKFKSNSDTEVILELFKKYRELCINKLIGMFSFCIYDSNAKELFLVRDYFGIKPLYYTLFDNKFAFSSELKALIKLPGINKELNPRSLVSSLNYLWIDGNESILKNINKVPAGHFLYLRLNNHKLEPKIKKYWELEYHNHSYKTEGQIVDQLKSLLKKCVKRHLVSDVEVGAFLSGGLDSSLIASIAVQKDNCLASFTINIGKKEKKVEAMPNDSYYAQKVAKLLKLRHTNVLIEPDIVRILPDIIYSLDEPIGDPAAINTYLICKLAKESGIKVLLSGMGADEIFAGYRRHQANLIASNFNKLPGLIRKTTGSAINLLPVRVAGFGVKPVRWLKRFLSFTDMSACLGYARSYSYYDKEELSKLLNNNFNQEIESIYSAHNQIFNKITNYDSINRMCYTDLNMFLPGLNLAYSDRASMSASVEVRVPFVDKELVEFAMAIPGNYKIKNGVSKYILKKAAADYLPQEIINRPKASFGMPIRAWLSGSLKDMIEELLSEANIKRRGLLNYKYVREIINQDRLGMNDFAYQIYQLLTLELWFKRFIDE